MRCAGCGDDFPADMMLAGKEDFFCAWCVGLDPLQDDFDAERFSPAEVNEMFWRELLAMAGADTEEDEARAAWERTEYERDMMVRY